MTVSTTTIQGNIPGAAAPRERKSVTMNTTHRRSKAHTIPHSFRPSFLFRAVPPPNKQPLPLLQPPAAAAAEPARRTSRSSKCFPSSSFVRPPTHVKRDQHTLLLFRVAVYMSMDQISHTQDIFYRLLGTTRWRLSSTRLLFVKSSNSRPTTTL